MKKSFIEQSLKVVLCALNSKYIHSSLAPWYLAAGVSSFCPQAGITVKVIEGTVNDALEEISRRILAENPQVIGLSCYIWNITATRQLLRLLKSKLPGAVMVLGGPEVSFNAAEILRAAPEVDYVISGEGERPFALLLERLSRKIPRDQQIPSCGLPKSCCGQPEASPGPPEGSSGQPEASPGPQDEATGGCATETMPVAEELRDIPGLCYRQGEKLILALPYAPREIPPSPYSEAYLAALKGRIAYLETSRGCPYSCAFCLSGRGSGVRFFDLERAKKEMLLLANSGTHTVKLVDRTFNCHPARARELFRFIIENYGKVIPQGVCFHFEIAGDILDEATLELLATAPVGAIQFEIGIQSFNEETLVAINRRTDLDRLEENIRRLVAPGNIHIHIDLIAGLPYEDLGSFAAGFNKAYAMQPHMLQLGFLKLLHGAPMREEAEKYPCRYREEPPYEVIETPWLSAEELRRLHDTEDALERLYNSGRFRRTLVYLLQQTGETPFTLFSRFGAYAAAQGKDGISLDDYTALVFRYFSAQKGVDPTVLRDEMVCDRLSVNASGQLPPVLRVQDPLLEKAIWLVEHNKATRPLKGVRRGYAYLYSEQCLVYADYRKEERNPVSGEYPLHKVPVR